MPKLTRIAVMLSAVLLVAGPAAAYPDPTTGEWVPEYVESPVYLHCNGDTKVGNLHAVADSKVVTWDNVKPTKSFTSGAGCGTADTFVEGTADHNPLYDFTTAGFYTGNVDTITVRLWAIEGAGRAGNKFDVRMHLKVDGEDVIKRGTVVNAVPIPSSTGVTRLYEVTVTGVGLSTLADHTTEHDVTLTVYPVFANSTGGGVAWVYDAAEIDSGLVFNDTTPAVTTIARNVARSTTP